MDNNLIPTTTGDPEQSSAFLRRLLREAHEREGISRGRIYDLESALRAILAVAEETRDDPDFTLATIRDAARVNLKLRPLAVKHPSPTLSPMGNGICDDPTVPLEQW